MPMVNAQFGSDVTRDIFGDRLQHDRIGASLLQRVRVLDETARVLFGASLLAEPAGRVHRLRIQPEMPHHRDPNLDQARNRFRDVPSAFDLDRVSSALLNQSARIADRFFGRNLVGQKRHVGDDERAVGAPADGLGVVNHLFQSDGERVAVAQQHHPQGIADQKNVDSGLLQHASHQRVVGGQHGDLLAALLHFHQVVRPDFLGLSGFHLVHVHELTFMG